MKEFLAVYIGKPAAFEAWNALSEEERSKREAAGMEAWIAWSEKHAAVTVVPGGPLGKTKRIAADGTSDIRNFLAGYIVVRAESHEAAAQLFVNHPHFTIFPGDSVEIMECLPLPEM